MKRCLQCGGQFGLIRHAYFRSQFCSRKCLESHKLDLERKREWLRWLIAERTRDGDPSGVSRLGQPEHS
jgi:hypothetical protein